MDERPDQNGIRLAEYQTTARHPSESTYTLNTQHSTVQAMKFLLFLLVINTSIATGVQGRNINSENTTGRETIFLTFQLDY